MFKNERAERGRVKEAEIEREEDDNQDLDIRGEINDKLVACKVDSGEIDNF